VVTPEASVNETEQGRAAMAIKYRIGEKEENLNAVLSKNSI
jgi:hypothetical protein